MVPLEIFVGIAKAWKKSLFRSQAGILGRDDDVHWSDCTSTSWSSNLILQEPITNFNQISISEYKTNVSFNMGQKFFKVRIVVHVTPNSFSHHGVFTRENNTHTSHGSTNLLHLF